MKCNILLYMVVIYVTRYNKSIITVIWLHNIEKVTEGSRIDNII